MIQRIQSLFLLLAALFFGGQFLWPLAVSDTAVSGFFKDYVYTIQDHIILTILTCAGIFISLVAIFMFKNRSKQMRMGYVIILLAILLPIAAILLYMNDASRKNMQIELTDGIGAYLPIGSIIFAFVANYFINKDKKVVSSMDRLR